MHTTKVKVALRRHVRNIRGNPALFTKFPNPRAGFGVVYGGEHHTDMRVVQIRGLEFPVDVLDLFAGDAVGDFGVQAFAGADYCHFCVGVE